MKIAFTICSNNYYAQAQLLAHSFLLHNPAFSFYIGLVDKKTASINYELSNTGVIAVDEIEPGIDDLALRYNIVELNTAVKPHYFQHFFGMPGVDQVFYLDPDILVYQSFGELSVLLETDDILLTPHILEPLPLDGQSPAESDFLNYGIYNLGFLALKLTEKTMRMLAWWKERTYRFGYHDLAKGLFVDQLWMNLVPILFATAKVIREPGYNMGPWNLHERRLTKIGNTYYVNDASLLYFYHFSNFDPAGNFELHTVFNRFKLKDRADLLGIYKDYSEKLYLNNFAELRQVACYYTLWRQQQLLQQQIRNYKSLPVADKFARRLKKSIPRKIRNRMLRWIQK